MIFIGLENIDPDEEFGEVYINGEKTNFYVGINGTVFNAKTKHVLKQRCNKNTDHYCEVCMHHNGKDYYKRVHRLVATAFIPNPKNKPQVNHMDCIKTNNEMINLEWCTAYENIQHAKKHGLMPVGERMGTNKYSNDQINDVCKLLESNKYTLQEISEKTNVYIDTVRDIKNHKSWIHISKLYNIAQKILIASSFEQKRPVSRI